MLPYLIEMKFRASNINRYNVITVIKFGSISSDSLGTFDVINLHSSRR